MKVSLTPQTCQIDPFTCSPEGPNATLVYKCQTTPIFFQCTSTREGHEVHPVISFLLRPMWMHLYKDCRVYIKYEPLSCGQCCTFGCTTAFTLRQCILDTKSYRVVRHIYSKKAWSDLLQKWVKMTFYLNKDSRRGKILHFLYVYEHQKRCTSSFLFFRDSRRTTERVAGCQLWHKRPLLYAVI